MHVSQNNQEASCHKCDVVRVGNFIPCLYLLKYSIDYMAGKEPESEIDPRDNHLDITEHL